MRLGIVREDGTEEEIEDDKLYKAACNMYAVNMLGMLNGLTRGLLKVVPKYADGSVVENCYDCSLRSADGREIKEWVAFTDYLKSLPEEDGVPTIPALYASTDNRKNKVAEGGLAVLRNPGPVTIAVIAVPVVILAVIVLLCLTHKKRKARREERRRQRAGKTA